MAKIKVSQATIDKIKAMGMTKALKGASKASPEMKEALTRMYGARRVSAAGGSSKPAAKSADAARAAAMKPKGATYKSADAARSAAMKADAARNKPAVRVPSKAGFGAYNMPNKPGAKGKAVTMPNKPGTQGKIVNMPNKKTGTTDPFAKFVFGVAKRVTSGQGSQKMTAAQVAAENKRRAAAVAAAKKNK